MDGLSGVVAAISANGCSPAVRGSPVADRILAAQGPVWPLGSVARGQFLLRLLADFAPTPAVEAAYFRNLAQLLATRPKLARPGRLVIGLGPGRCGSTSLTYLAGSLPDACATHENPPIVHWVAQEGQLAFHLRRFAVLRQYFAVVFDAAHWWLNAVPTLLEHVPDARFVGLRRELSTCVDSFMRIKGVGPGSLNHWVRPDTGAWRETDWDASYPNYPLPVSAGLWGATMKAGLIARYIGQYHATLEAMATRWPRHVLLLRTEALSARVSQAALYRFIEAGTGVFGDIRLNTDTVTDGAIRYRY